MVGHRSFFGGIDEKEGRRGIVNTETAVIYTYIFDGLEEEIEIKNRYQLEKKAQKELK